MFLSKPWSSALFLLAALLCASKGFCAPPRVQISLDGEWKFQFRADETATATTFDDKAWSTVLVPHSWPAEDKPLSDESFRTRGTYRRTFAASPDWRKKRVILRFDAASLVADVYVNGQHVGRHEGGFAAFNFDITDALHFGKPNVLAVQVSNEKNPDVSPLAGDFLIYGGLYRHVSLQILDPINITPLDAASSGVFVSTQSLAPHAATISVLSELRNELKSAQAITQQTEVLDASQRVVSRAEKSILLPAHQTISSSEALSWTTPHLWNGIRDPYLYSIRVTLRQGGRTLDSSLQTFGLRTIRFDPHRGLILNGRSMQIRGVCLHQEGATSGWAVSADDEKRDMQIIREMGADGIRLAHYQHSQSFLDLADRFGMLIWAELAQVDHVTDSPAYRRNIRQQLMELIRQNYNHPSIFTWSLYNELNPPTKDAAIPLVKELNLLAHTEDPSRPTTGADDKGTLEQFHSMVEDLDLIAFNTYPGWYFGKPSDMGAEIDKWNAQYGSRGIAVSEYGAGASIHQHQPLPDQKAVQIRGAFHPEEWQTAVHEQAYPAIRERSDVWGAFIWNIFDFGSYGRHEGDTPGVNDKGLVTRDRKVKKDAYYFYQANWGTDPMAHITNCRYAERAAGDMQVKVFSNQESISLQINGVPIGSRKPDTNHTAIWEGVKLTPGTATLEIVSAGGVADRCVLTVTAATAESHENRVATTIREQASRP